ncbi:AI-2E family transporter [Jannaschia seosinensis]|nr:AI-2E family transporter [Jannaschia seosinensis]
MSDQNRRPKFLWYDGEADWRWFLGFMLLILTLWAFHAAASVALLVTGGFFAALLVLPLDRAVADRLPDGWTWIAHVIAAFALVLGLAVLAGALAYCAVRVASEFQNMSDGSLSSMFDTFGSGDAGDGQNAGAGADTEGSTEPAGAAAGVADNESLFRRFGLDLENLVSQAAQWTSQFITGAMSSALAVVTGLILIVFLALMMLIVAPHWGARIRVATDRHVSWINAVEVLGRAVRRFALVRLAMGVLTAVLYSIWIWIMGIDLIWTWAILTVVFTFVPTLGSIISGVLPVIYAVFMRDIGTALLLGAGLFVIEQVIGNFVDPKVAGDQVDVSPLVVLISLLVWGWILGPAGTLLATPLTLAIVVFAARIEPLRPLSLMLSNRPDYESLDNALSCEGERRDVAKDGRPHRRAAINRESGRSSPTNPD